MKKGSGKICADAGSKYCPCHLAYCGECIKCPLIRGEKCLNCSWQGVCIYNELEHSKNSKIMQREEYICDIKDIKEIRDNVYLIKIQVPKNIIIDLKSPGAYLLIKGIDKDSDIFNAPISVMDVDDKNSILEIVIKPIGVKTKNIITFKKIRIKGPYFNGIFGIKEIKSTARKNVVVIGNGLSLVNSINVVKRLIENNNKVEVFVNNQAEILNEVVEKLEKLGVNVYITDINENRNFLLDYIKRNDISLVYSAGGNRFNKYIMDIVDGCSRDISFAISNNNLICCGEGICGACTINVNGEKVKSCKMQIDSRDFLNSSNV